MRVLLLVAVTVFAVGRPAYSQALAPSPVVPVDVLAGYELVGPIRLTPDTPGDELVFRGRLWRHVIVIAVPHPAKSGPSGIVAAPGLCLEPAQAFAVTDPQIAIADINGDGRDDIVGTAHGAAQVLWGMALSACR